MAKKRKRRDSKKSRKALKRPAPTLFRVKSTLRQAGQWPLLECLIHAGWRDTHQITQILVARQSPRGQVATGAFVVDLACLGVKNAFAALFPSARGYRREMRSGITDKQEMVTCDLNLAAKVIETAVDYAGSLGFKPNKDIKDALLVMGETHSENNDTEIPVGGEDGQPMFIAGPYDDVEQIMRKLDRKVGEGNYHFLTPIGPLGFFDDQFDDWEDEDEQAD